MCSIHHEKKAIFIHIPKTGGSYIADILHRYYGFQHFYLQRPDHSSFCMGKDQSVRMHENKIHGTLMYYKTSNDINRRMNMTPQKWKEYFIFTFVRNPYDRIVSGWNYCNQTNISFEQYIEFDQSCNAYDYWHVFMPQVRHIIGDKGKIAAHFIGKFETMEKDLATILSHLQYQQIIHIPFQKNSKKHKPYMDYYSNHSIIEKVNKLIQEDLTLCYTSLLGENKNIMFETLTLV